MKERLVGAAVLVAIGVWLIPWVLDGPDEPLDSSGNPLQLPAAEEPMPMRTQTLRLGDDEPAAETPAPAATPSAPIETAATTGASRAHEAPSETDAPASNTAAPVVASAPAPKPTPAAAAQGDWIVQLGTFGEEANAGRLAQRAETYGYDADVSTYRANGRTLFRVRVGPATTRALADAKASALRAHGIDEASVVAAR